MGYRQRGRMEWGGRDPDVSKGTAPRETLITTPASISERPVTEEIETASTRDPGTPNTGQIPETGRQPEPAQTRHNVDREETASTQDSTKATDQEVHTSMEESRAGEGNQSSVEALKVPGGPHLKGGTCWT